MKKKRTKPTPAGPPTWFPTLENLPPYHTVRVPLEHVEGWLDGILEFAEQPTTHAIYRELYLRQQRFAHTIASRDWGQENGHQLLWWGMAHGSLRHGLDTFLPPPYDALPLAVRQWLYAHVFLVQGPQAIPQLERIMAMWLAAPYVRAELGKRAAKQLGSSAGVLLFVHDLMRLTEADPMTLDVDISAVAERAIEQLRRSTWRTAAARTKRALPHTPDHEHRSELKAHLSGAIWKTITEKWGHLQGLDAIAQALDGKMRIAPTAIADDIMGELHHIFPSAAASYTKEIPATKTTPKKRRRHYVAEIPIPGDSRDDPRKLNADEQMASGDWLRVSITERHDDRIDFRALCERFVREHPERRDGIDLYLYDGPLTQKEQAKVIGVREQTLINWKNRAVDAFRQWVTRLDS